MNKIKNSRQGFTLLELLVVVLIIGILAAIALPQYRLAVGKTKFATLKNITKSLAESANRYYLANGVYPKNYTDLDLNFSVSSGTSTYFTPSTGKINYCTYWTNNDRRAACYMNISKKLIGYYASYNGGRPMYCYASGTDKKHVTHKICQQDTGKNESQGICQEDYCLYNY